MVTEILSPACHGAGASIFTGSQTNHSASLTLRLFVYRAASLIPHLTGTEPGCHGMIYVSLSGTLPQICCDTLSPLGVRVQSPAPGLVWKERCPRRRHSRSWVPGTTRSSHVEPTLPGHLLDFLREVLGNDATFLLLLFVFA